MHASKTEWNEVIQLILSHLQLRGLWVTWYFAKIRAIAGRAEASAVTAPGYDINIIELTFPATLRNA